MSDLPPPAPPAHPAPAVGGYPAYGQPAAYGQPGAPQPYGYGQPVAYGQPVGYGQPTAYGQPVAYAQPTNTLAIVALILGLSGFIFFITGIGGIVCGHIALSQVKRTGQNGRGLAIAGLVSGYVSVGLLLLFIVGYVVFFVLFIGAMAASAGAAAYS
jgi:hypothetical protein